MATKKPAVTTLLKQAKARIEELERELATSVKQTANEKSMKEMYSKQKDEAVEELDQLHGLLDALPGCLPRKSDAENSWERKDYAAMTRLASWLAVRA